jgi:hypothetical protein
MRVSTRLQSRRRASVRLALMIVLMAAAGTYGTPARADDGCGPAEPLACLAALPAAVDAALQCRPLPQLARPPALEEAPRVARSDVTCLLVEVTDAVNRANVLYVRAMRGVDAQILTEVWDGDALAAIDRQIAALHDAGRFATPRLLSISLIGWEVTGDTATVRTIEHWLDQERDAATGDVLDEQERWVEGMYVLERRDRGWVVVERT